MTDQPPLEPLQTPPFDPPPPVPPAPRRRDRAPAVIGVAVIVALLGGIAALYVTRDAGRSAAIITPTSTAPRPTTTEPVGPPTERELEDVVAEISAFVAEARQLEFDHAVKVDLLDDDAFSQRVRDDASADIEELDKIEGVLRALGLLAPDDDLADALASLLGDSVVGFYDPETDELVARGASITPYVRLTLAHELTHALDDQQFELDRPTLDEADDESGTGFSALVEGNALRIEDAYRETLTDDERRQADDEEARLGAGLDISSVPRVLTEIIAFPYAFGPALLDALVQDGGEERVNQAFTDPPITSEQVVDPQGWLSGRQDPIRVEPPVADGEIVDQGEIGFWGIVLLLEDELGQAEAVPLAEGWGGDWYVAWKRGDDTCVRGTIVMDSASDLGELVAGLEQWADAQPDAQIDATGDRVTYEACS